MKVDETLEQRGKVYGSYETNVQAVSDIMRTLQEVYREKNGVDMSLFDCTNIQYIVIKLVRLGATPNHKDSWLDIQGYAKLSEDMFNHEVVVVEDEDGGY